VAETLRINCGNCGADVGDDGGGGQPSLRAHLLSGRVHGLRDDVQEVPASSEADALRTLMITEHLLKSIYELPGLAQP
jgi:hypothetical protein